LEPFNDFALKPLFFLVSTALCCSHAVVAQAPDTAFKPYQQPIPGSGIQFQMVPIKGGTFKMGSPASDKAAQPSEGPQRTVTISPFWMGAHEVTHDEFDLFFKDDATSQNSKMDAVTRPSPQYIDLSWGMGKEGGYPVNSMQQLAALMYCRWLYQKTGTFYRLPTEAEWEYAARAGATTVYPFGDDPKDLGKYAWYGANSKGVYQKVGQLQPNAWGLYDMLGNVAEWTMDQYDDGYLKKLSDGATDPYTPPTSRHPKAVRGGSFQDDAPFLRPANRLSWDPEWNKRDPQIPKSRWWLTDAAFVGFRIVRPVKQPTKEEAEAFYKTQIGQ
jgi:formylglycine-generating enzyme required for sulfatase activity